VTAHSPPAQRNRRFVLAADARFSPCEDAPSAHERWVKAMAVSTRAISPEITSMRGRMVIVILLVRRPPLWVHLQSSFPRCGAGLLLGFGDGAGEHRPRPVDMIPGRQVAQGSVGAILIVVPSPCLHPLLSVRHRQEPGLVRALPPEPAVERLHDGVVRRLGGPDEVQGDTVPVGPLVHHPRGEPRPVVHPRADGHCPFLNEAVQYVHHVIAGQPEAYLSARLSRLWSAAAVGAVSADSASWGLRAIA
jgi:hypothetical protein